MHTMYGRLPATREEIQLSNVLALCGLMTECWDPQPAKRVDAPTFQNKVDLMVSNLAEINLIDSEQLFLSLPFFLQDTVPVMGRHDPQTSSTSSETSIKLNAIKERLSTTTGHHWRLRLEQMTT